MFLIPTAPYTLKIKSTGDASNVKLTGSQENYLTCWTGSRSRRGQGGPNFNPNLSRRMIPLLLLQEPFIRSISLPKL